MDVPALGYPGCASLRRRTRLAQPSSIQHETWVAAGGGIVFLIAYGIIIFAMSLGPMGPVSALRETSVTFAALIGRFFVQERLTVYRLAGCIVVALGAICIGHSE
jgi:drug/metabolite transporter (DMT)-like permease